MSYCYIYKIGSGDVEYELAKQFIIPMISLLWLSRHHLMMIVVISAFNDVSLEIFYVEK